ncbi:alpha/beta-hydrolase [Cryphonectria parasitica EP155]|uniref:Alpha/beta-hydrolase n=1 Tax=Cryphonectria parasitica (strain ATCC 38755 / EP155) TaxID=660469 RepID=A0A9P4Y1G8_CRYP1|nr:alpha/beta-hydrolase [Cryphonectria parasitica EP155]KAF3764637.1 alpha/beta-hydrolase [Cryphonectria parasitica EP155]
MTASEQEVWDKLPLVADVLKHPAFPTATWNLEPTKSGRLPVAEGRGGPLKIAWEVHGSGPVRLVFLMGLGSFKSAWQRQTLHFGHEREQTYSVLCLDNRGMGDSDVPLMRYSTSEMARDAIEVLQHIDWLPRNALSPSSSSPPPERTLHVLGISMGGMIAQELACLVPGYLSTLSLLCTAANVENTTTFWENMVQRAQMLIPKSLEASVRSGGRNLFPLSYFVSPDYVHLPDPKTTPKVLPPSDESGGGEYLRFNNNYERFVAGELHKRLDEKRFTTKGFLLQLIAAGWHHKSPQQLADMADRVGRERILLLHGTADKMITVPHGYKLKEYLGGDDSGLTAIIEQDMGHVPPLERYEWFHELVEKRFRIGEQLDGRKWPSA